MKVATVADIKTCTPTDEIFLKLSVGEQQEYADLYSIYSGLLYHFFIQEFRFNEYNEALLDSPYPFQPVEAENMDFYQYLASDLSKYYYIRNTLYISRLTEKERQILWSKKVGSELIYDKEAENLIRDSYRRIMTMSAGEESSLNISFGPDNKNFFCPANAIVMGVRYDDYYKMPGESSEKWLERRNRSLQDIETLAIVMETRFKIFSGLPCCCIKYNDFSCIGRETTGKSVVQAGSRKGEYSGRAVYNETEDSEDGWD